MTTMTFIKGRFAAPVYCRRCNETLFESGKSRCPSCGIDYDTDDPATIRNRPMLLKWKYWFPGFCLSVASGVISYAICLTQGDLGFVLFVAVPISFGAILGYGTRVGGFLTASLGIVVVASVVLALISASVAGFFCGMTLGFIFILPMLFGVILGMALRGLLHASRWDQRHFLPIALIALLPYLVQVIESSFPHRCEIATMRTALTVHATPAQAWNAIMFYEDVEHSPPWLLHLALPKPIRSTGDKSREGQIVRCFYDRGYLTKRISRVTKNRRLEFDVVEQKLHFERDVKLLDGSFALERSGKHKTRIVLTTRYERLLSPRFVWQPIEQTVVHTLHEHVLEGMRREAEAPRGDAVDEIDAPYVPERLAPIVLAAQ